MTSAAPATPAPTAQASIHLRLSGRSRFVGAMFLMATSAFGPGFLTQTTAWVMSDYLGYELLTTLEDL